MWKPSVFLCIFAMKIYVTLQPFNNRSILIRLGSYIVKCESFFMYICVFKKAKQMKTKICSFWYKKLKSGLTSVYLYSYAGKGKYDKRSLSLYLRPDTPENRLLNEETRRTMQKIMFNETERLKKIYKIWFIVVKLFCVNFFD